MKKYVAYLKTLPKKRIACGVLLFNKKNELLLLNLSYKKTLNIPGGVIEEHESLIQGLLREIKEEIGLSVKIKSCLIIDYGQKKINGFHDESLQLIFLGHTLTAAQIKKIKVDGQEVTGYAFYKLNTQTYKLINPRVAKRLKILKNNFSDKTIFSENFKKIL